MTRRSAGEGGVRLRSDGRWEARLQYEDADGVVRVKSFYASTKGEAQGRLNAAKDRVRVQAPVEDSKLTLAAWINQWISTSLAASSRKPSTRDLYATLARKHLAVEPLGVITLDRLRKSNIEGLIVKLRQQGLSDSTIRTTYTVLRAILADAKADGLIADNAAVRVPRPKVSRKEATFMTPEQVAALLAAAKGSQYYKVLVLIAGSGVRRGEALGLRWEDVDLAYGEIRLRQTLNRLRSELVTSTLKTDKSRRTIPLSPALVSMLKQHKAAQAADRLRAGQMWTDHGLVFTNELGRAVDPRSILRAVKTAATKAGLKDTVVHSLRHSAATAWLDQGVHIRAVADLLGHSSISITGDIYAHSTNETARAAVDKLSSTLGL